MQTSGTNYAIAQTVLKADFIIKVIECLLGPTTFVVMWCDVGVIISFTFFEKKNNTLFNILIHNRS